MRFSRPEQARGDSIRRQTKLTAKWCEEVGLVLDETLTDRGVSAYRGKHRVEGALGGFVRAFEEGKLPQNAVLIIESLDRLSREKVRISQQELLHLINGGLTVVTLLDKQEYSAEVIDENPWLLFQALAIAQRAHEESATKAKRLSNSWDGKRQAMSSGQARRQHFPAWLKWSKGQIEVIEERKKILLQIFKDKVAGMGHGRIVAKLNDAGVEPWGTGKRKAKGGWQESYITKLITSRALLGEFQPHQLVNGRRVPIGDVVKGVYPAIIPLSLWHAAQSVPRADHKPAVGRISAGNLFSGLVFDPLGGKMHVVRKGEKCDYLTTAQAFRRKGRPVFNWRIDHFHQVMMPLLSGLDWSRVFANVEVDQQLNDLRTTLAELVRESEAVDAKLDRAAEALLDATGLGAVGDVVREKAKLLTVERDRLNERISSTKTALASLEREQRVGVNGGTSLKEALANLKDESMRERFRREIRVLISRITLYPDGDVAGFPVEEIRDTAAAMLKGNRGLLARERGMVCGAIRIEFCSGKQLVIWVTRRPSQRVVEEPAILAVNGLGYETAEWLRFTRDQKIPSKVVASG